MNQGAKVQSIASALYDAREHVAMRWLERVSARVSIDKHFVFPSEDLLDEVPVLIAGIAQHLGDETHELSVDLPVVLKARELGRLRHAQGFSARQILWEYEILASIILQFLDELDPSVGAASIPEPIIRRLLRALATVQRATVEEFVDNSEAQIKEREDRLRGFNRALSHELRNEMGAILGAARMLREGFVQQNPEHRDRFIGMVIQNGERVEVLLNNLIELARFDLDSRRHRNVLLQHAAEEVARRLRGFAESKGVRIEIACDLPALEVNAAGVDFCLTNLIANSIKYHDPARTDRWVRVRASSAMNDALDRLAIIEVVDNGRGVPEDDRPRLFERFFRSTNATGEEGTGLGLALVRDVTERLGGKVWPEFPENETVFVFTLPGRRESDSVASPNVSGLPPTSHGG